MFMTVICWLPRMDQLARNLFKSTIQPTSSLHNLLPLQNYIPRCWILAICRWLADLLPFQTHSYHRASSTTMLTNSNTGLIQTVLSFLLPKRSACTSADYANYTPNLYCCWMAPQSLLWKKQNFSASYLTGNSASSHTFDTWRTSVQKHWTYYEF